MSYTPVGPETYSSRPFMHKIPLCETLSKYVMIGANPEVCLWSVSLEAALQFPFLSVSMRLSIMWAYSGHSQADTEKPFNPNAISKELVFFNLQRCYLIQHLAV